MLSRTLATVPKTYAERLSSVRRGLIDGQMEIDRVWVRSYHEILLRQGYGGQAGRLITKQILLNERADCGAKLYYNLARDAGGDVTRLDLYQCSSFYRCFPILQTSAKLPWTHYCVPPRGKDASLPASASLTPYIDLRMDSPRRHEEGIELVRRLRRFPQIRIPDNRR